tara:strand:- start:21006 stop:21596 length:591 start_codon:yes stop_codon:yes gene_type:complete
MSELRVDTITSLTSSAVSFVNGLNVTGTANVSGNLSVTGTVSASGDITTTGTLTAPGLSVSGNSTLTTANITTATATTVNATNLTVSGVPYSEIGCFAFGSFLIDGDNNISSTVRFNLSNTITRTDLGNSTFRYGFTFSTAADGSNYLPLVTIHPIIALSGGLRVDVKNLTSSGFDVEVRNGDNRDLDMAIFQDLS